MAQAIRGRGVDPRRRVRRDREAGVALVQQWRSSGQTPTQFCRTHGVGAHRLHYWRRKLDSQGEPQPSLGGEFLALSAPVGVGAGERERGNPEMVVELRAMDVVVRLPMAAGPAGVVQTLRGVLEALAR
jgi:transposase-like protein